MKKIVYCIITYSLLAGLYTTKLAGLYTTKTYAKIKIIKAAPGQEVLVNCGDANPEDIDVHKQHEMRFIKDFSCKTTNTTNQDSSSANPECVCKLKIKNKIPEGKETLFSVFEDQKDEPPKVHAFIKVVPEKKMKSKSK